MKEFENTEADNGIKPISMWDPKDPFWLIEFIRFNWTYPTYFKKYWGKEKFTKKPCLFFELHTAGWSGNEEIIKELEKHKSFFKHYHTKWERGGHYYFEIMPGQLGYMTVAEYCKEKKVSRQYISKIKDRFDWLTITNKTKMLREKPERKKLYPKP